ncbi:MAG: LysM peptidoglycan-binding domain-containing protein [Alphaproteobacteria bacterium]|nr:LysM peptidoglycan-binding domain-containing protein [Alphaproteobacteria bacterium]
MRGLARWLVLAAVVVLAACGTQRPAPVVMGSSGDAVSEPSSPPAETTVEKAGKGGTVMVRTGDSLFAISRRHGVSMRALIALNGLSPPYTLEVGQVLALPAELLHEVVKGDTLSGIARRYQVSMRDLARINGLADPYVIALGQLLRIPASIGPAEAIAAVPTEPVAVTAVAPETNTVVITSAGTTVEPAPDVAAEPVAAVEDEPEPVAAVEDEPEPVAAVEDEPEPVVAVEDEVVLVQPTAAALPQVAVEQPAPEPEPAPREGMLFAWPVRGKLISSFGVKSGGLSNDGINIAATQGTPVLAAENGVVVYAGNEIPGYGNLVLVRHTDGWVTAYAHNETLKVEKSDAVKRGQPIATAGATGNVATPQVHFEIRKGNDPVDPLKFLADD